MRVIQVARKVSETPPLSEHQERELESQRILATRHTNFPEIHPRTPKDLYRYRVRLLGSIGKINQELRKEKDARNENGWQRLLENLHDDKSGNDIAKESGDESTKESEEGEEQGRQLSPVPNHALPDFSPPYFHDF